MEVYVREKCDNQACLHGKVLTDNINYSTFPWVHCGNCHGIGYVETWIDLEILVEHIKRSKI